MTMKNIVNENKPFFKFNNLIENTGDKSMRITTIQATK